MAASSMPEVVTPSDHEAVLALAALDLALLLKAMAPLIESKKELNRQLKIVDDQLDIYEEIVTKKMFDGDTPSMTVEYGEEGRRMKFTVSSKTYPKMVQGSFAAVRALEAYSARLRAEGKDHEAEAIDDMLTIKGQSLAPMLTEWLMTETELPSEFDGVIEPSTRFGLSKTAQKSR